MLSNQSDQMLASTKLKSFQETDQYLKKNFGVDRNNLSGISRPSSNFRGLTLLGANFSHANLKGADFRGSVLMGANFDQADLRGSLFSGATVRAAMFTSTLLTGANFEKAVLTQASFEGANLNSGDYLINGTIIKRRTTLDFALINQVNFKKSLLKGVSLKYANLRYSNFQGAKMGISYWNEDHTSPYTDFRSSDLTNADLSGVNLQEVIIGQSKLDMANLSDCDLRRQIFKGLGSFWLTDFTGANLSYIRCRDKINIIGANLEGSDLSGAMLQKAVFSSPPAHLTGATYNEKTQFPEGFSPKGKGLIMK